MQNRARWVAAFALSLSALALSACGDDANDESDAAPATTAAADAPPCTVDDITVKGAFGKEPEITIPNDCSAPTTLLSKDLEPGSGAEAQAGATVETNYHLVTWSNGQVLDSSFQRGETFPLENLGQASVIAGWNEGLIGVKKGARRLLIVPPDKGYGAGGNGVQPNETLVFVVDAVNVS